MKLSLLSTTPLALLHMQTRLASAHYFFDTLVIDGHETASNQYIRSNTCSARYNPTKWINIRDDITPDDTDFRCNKGSFTFAPSTEMAEIQAEAGARLVMKLAVGATISITGTGTTSGTESKSQTIQFPGGYKQDDPSFTFSVWDGIKEYPMPGPELWTGSPSSTRDRDTSFVSSSSSSSGFIPSAQTGSTYAVVDYENDDHNEWNEYGSEDVDVDSYGSNYAVEGHCDAIRKKKCNKATKL
ncbi:hypothetical protein BDV19DRAFT_385838 [Aspergillus venezuelensis]